jgi:hypothetical protein
MSMQSLAAILFIVRADCACGATCRFGLALVAALFSCYHAQQRRNFHMAQQRQAAASGRPATLIISRSLPASLGAFRGMPLAQQLDQQVWMVQQDLMAQQRSIFHGYRTCTGKTPTPPSIIQNLPVVIYEHPAHASDEEHRNATEAGMKSADATAETCSASTETGRDVEEGRDQCVICCCEYQTGDLVKLLPCLHTFHEGECAKLSAFQAPLQGQTQPTAAELWPEGTTCLWSDAILAPFWLTFIREERLHSCLGTLG